MLTVSLQSFGTTSKQLLRQFYNRRLTSAEDIITRLSFIPCDDIIEELEDQFQLAFCRYLRGSGHPNTPIIEELIPADER